MAASPRRLRGWIAVLIFVVVSALGVTGAWYLIAGRPAPGDIVELVNIDGDFAVAVRTVRGESRRSFVSMFEREHGERWGGLIPHYPDNGDARTGVAASAEVIAVRTVSSGLPTIMAFAARRGQKLGRVELLGQREDREGKGLSLAAVQHLVGDGEAFELYGEDGQWATLFGLDLQAGMVRWQRDLGPLSIRRAWLQDRHVVLDARDGMVLVDRASGDVHETLDAGELPCVLDQTVYSVTGGALRARDLQTSNERTISLPGMQTGAANPIELRGLCGMRDHRLVMAVAGSLLIIDTTAPDAPARLLPLNAAWHLDAVAWQAPDRAPLSGQLTRFVPVLLGQRGDPARAGVLAMLDIDSGQVAWQRELPWLAGARLMRDGNHHYLYAPERARLLAFDGDTGQLTGARDTGGAGVWPEQVAGGNIWIFRGPDWAVLDGNTLAVMPSVGRASAGEDITAELTTELGLGSDR